MRVRPFQPRILEQILRREVERWPGMVGVYMTDLMSGLSAGVNPEEPFYGASTLKVPIAMAVLWLVDRGRLSLNEPIIYLPQDYQGGTGTLQATIQPGDEIPVRELLDLMITVSDNIARNMLERFIGSGTIREYMLRIGIQPPYDPVTRVVTPEGMNQALIALDTRRSGLSLRSTRMLLHWMEKTVHRSRIPRYMPPGVVVANKIGTWPGQVHDIALVYAPYRSFSVAVFTRGIAEAQAEEAIGRIARTIYDYQNTLVA